MPIPTTNATTKALDREHVFHSWSAQGAIDPVVLAGGKGCEVWDFDGMRWFDPSHGGINLSFPE